MKALKTLLSTLLLIPSVIFKFFFWELECNSFMPFISFPFPFHGHYICECHYPSLYSHSQ
uniref:Uncharacterized protein n=1 Tax=Catharus ustulatus TaxID=91951 RepID=A0A8C3Y562_CATUS